VCILAILFITFVFALMYNLDTDGLDMEDDRFRTVLLFSFSLASTSGGGAVQPISSFGVLVACLQTLVTQFVFVFITGVVYSRLAQPMPCLRLSCSAVLFDSPPTAPRSFSARTSLANRQSSSMSRCRSCSGDRWRKSRVGGSNSTRCRCRQTRCL
jgi:hypothetical protein